MWILNEFTLSITIIKVQEGYTELLLIQLAQ
jgi:hypothetical protein